MEIQELQNGNAVKKQKLPFAVAGLVLGILSIANFNPLTLFLSGDLGSLLLMVPGIVLGIIGFITSKISLGIYNKNPKGYYGVGMAKTGKVFAFLGVVLPVIPLLLDTYTR